MTLTMTEGALDAVKDHLEEKMPAKIVAINERATDNNPVEVPGLYAIGEPELIGVSEWPICYVVSSGFELLDFKVQPGSVWVRARHKMMAGIICVDSEPERLTRRKVRTVQAVFELLVESLAVPGNLNGFQLDGRPVVNHGRTYGQGEEYGSEGWVDFALIREETST